MTEVSVPQYYERQQSSDSGWDNPFRPDGDLSREADKIVNLIRGGKPITPTGEISGYGEIKNGEYKKDFEVKESMIKSNVTQIQTVKNGNYTSQKQTDLRDELSSNQISKQIIPGPTSASHVIIDGKNKKKSCCIIQ